MHPQGRNTVEKLACKLARASAPARTWEPESAPGRWDRGDLAGSGCWTEAESGSYRRSVETGADIIPLWPRWMDSVGAMLGMNGLVRTHCAQCGALLRVELEDIVARYGPGYSLVDRLERCRMVGCHGATIYRASRTYGREWTTLLRDPVLLASFETMPPAHTALDVRAGTSGNPNCAPAVQHPHV